MPWELSMPRFAAVGSSWRHSQMPWRHALRKQLRCRHSKVRDRGRRTARQRVRYDIKALALATAIVRTQLPFRNVAAAPRAQLQQDGLAPRLGSFGHEALSSIGPQHGAC